MPDDYGEPFYVEAHGGKNNVILYRSKADPNLAIEFFFRSSSKDGRSRYYRCTKCWYLYKLRRGTCATLIVRDGRIVTDPENPGVPHQCDFRPIETVAANRVCIANRKRKLNHHSWHHSYLNLHSPVNEPTQSLIGEESLKREINLEANFNSSAAVDDSVDDPQPTLSVFERFLSAAASGSSMPSPSTSQTTSADSPDINQPVIKLEEGVDTTPRNTHFAPCTSRSSELVSLLNGAFADSMQKHSEEALNKLLKAVSMKQGFDTDDVSLIDNAYACQMNKAVELSDKISICEQWLTTLRELLPAESTRWISHYQFSVYYCFHMIGLYSLRTRTFVDRRRLFDLSQTIFRGLLECCNEIRETVEEIIASKLDILLSLSFLCTHYCDVSDQEANSFVQSELQSLEECVKGNYPTEVAALMVQKVYRIGDNLDRHRQALADRTAL